MKPWEETWHAEDPGTPRVRDDEGRDVLVTFMRENTESSDAAILAAAAPELVRALMAVREDIERDLTDDPTDEQAKGRAATIDSALSKAGISLRQQTVWAYVNQDGTTGTFEAEPALVCSCRRVYRSGLVFGGRPGFAGYAKDPGCPIHGVPR